MRVKTPEIIVVLFILIVGTSEAVTVSIPELYAKPGETVVVPINIDDATGIVAVDLKLSYPSTALLFQKAELTALTDGFSFEVNSKEKDALVIPMASKSPMQGKTGAFIELIFKVDPDALEGTGAPLKFEELILWNEDAEQVECKLIDGRIIIGSPPPKRTIGVKVSSAQSPPMGAVIVKILVDDASDVLAFDITLNYDPAILSFQGAITTALTKDFTMEVNHRTPGTLILVLASKEPITEGKGSVLELAFSVKPSTQTGASSPLTLKEAMFWNSSGERIEERVVNGTVTVTSEPVQIGRFTLELAKGLNIVSLPVKPSVPLNARAFAEKLGATVIATYDVKRQEFIPFIPELPGDGFPIEGGRGYIVNVIESKKVSFTGTVWSSAPELPYPQNQAWAFAFAGRCNPGQEAVLIVKNIRTGKISSCPVRSDGWFSMIWVDMSKNPVVRAGDIVEITLESPNCDAIHITRRIRTTDVERAYLMLEISDFHPPIETRLYQNYPNPFNPETWIPFQLAEPAYVLIRIYDVAGNLVKVINAGWRNAGEYLNRDRAVYWDGRNEKGEFVTSGVYFIEMQAGKFKDVKKAVVLR
ncbi:hypothetical protein J7M22_08645 [Candidatus Poribacteria bacterium]|nr:hypothetical protein [Candidatus Poribacteria bacterium]